MSDTPTLLFVDDEPSILAALRRVLRPYGYRILLAEGGAAGLEILEREAVDLIVSDMRMPQMDGVAFLKAARLRWPNAARILLTGYADMTSTVAAINEGAIQRYIAKPWEDDELINAIQEALARQQLERANHQLSELTLRQNEELRELNASLEQQVAERTSELRATLASVEQAHGELKNSFLTSVQVFANLIETRHLPVGSLLAGHSRRVAELARSLALRLALPDEAVQTVMLAGLLHDIGKFNLPDELIGRAFSTLSPEQQAQVTKHPAIGQNILLGIEQFRDLAPLVRHHHECFDGSGFPDRLAGNAIPLGSRILAVANDYDALQIGTLVSPPRTGDAALDYLTEHRGRRYDPAVVDALVQLLADKRNEPGDERALGCAQLEPGMVLSRDLIHPDGYLLLAHGNPLSAEIIAQLSRIDSQAPSPLTLHVRQEAP